MNIKRLSDTKDNLPVIISTRHNDKVYEVGKIISVDGFIKTRNYTGDDGKNHTMVFVYAEKVTPEEDLEDTEDFNSVSLKGTICKLSKMRTTTSGRKVTDMILAIHRDKSKIKNKSDYIPCIVWGKDAIEAEKMPIGIVISAEGRIQSRYYMKNDEEHVAYEVSIKNLTEENVEDCTEESA